MADITLTPRSALAPFLHAGHHSANGKSGVTLREVTPVSLLELTAFRDTKSELASTMKARFGVTLPAANKTSSIEGLTIISIAPGKWILVDERSDDKNLVNSLQTAVGSLGAVVDQSDARAIVEISGPHARKALEKGVMIDLDPVNFLTGDAATSFAVQFWITLWKTSELPNYRIAVFRSLGRDLLHWLESSAAEYGLTISATQS